MSSEVLQQAVLIVHLLLALAIIGLIMLQQGKGAEMGASFGAGASQTLFGSGGGGNVLTRTTAWMVALFFATSFGLAVIAKQRTESQNDLGIAMPPAVETAVQQSTGSDDDAAADLPVVEDSETTMSAGDLPAADDIPDIEE